MKKKVSMLMCIVLVLTVVLSLTGCSGSDKAKLIGTWQCEIDMAEQLNAEFAADPETAEYLSVDEFSIVMTLEFKEDDTYTISVDEEALENTMDAFVEMLSEGMSRYMEDLMLDQTGVEMSIDEILTAAGMTMDDLMAQIPVEDLIDELLSTATQEGNYKAENGKLYTSESLDAEVSMHVYEAYDLQEDTLTLEELVGAESDGVLTYPIRFQKVS